jgi:hypothetical protein
VITGSLGLVEAQDPEREPIERALGRPVAATARAAWGFTNRTDMVTLVGGQRAVVQRYRHREDAGYRLRVMQGLSGPAIEAGIPLPEGLTAGATGSAQTTKNGDLFVSWGGLSYFSEFSPSGKLLFNARLPIGTGTYRAYRLPWIPGS